MDFREKFRARKSFQAKHSDNPRKGCNCGVKPNTPHGASFYLRRGHDVEEDMNPPRVWAAFQRTGPSQGLDCWTISTIKRDQEPETKEQAAARLRQDFIRVANFFAYHAGRFSYDYDEVDGRAARGFFEWADSWRQSAEGLQYIFPSLTIFCR